jgi:hypothetical protein
MPEVTITPFSGRFNSPDFPSLDDGRIEGPHGWVQWKGTNVCMDLHCQCGAMLHADEDFFYHFKCGECGQIYEVSGFVRLFPLDHHPDRGGNGIPILYDDDAAGRPTWTEPEAQPGMVTLQATVTARLQIAGE